MPPPSCACPRLGPSSGQMLDQLMATPNIPGQMIGHADTAGRPGARDWSPGSLTRKKGLQARRRLYCLFNTPSWNPRLLSRTSSV
jgi:hypothetical protein